MSRWNNESLVATLWCCLVIGCACSSCVCQICESEHSGYLMFYYATSGSIDILLRFRCGSKHEVRSCGLESASGFSIDRRNFRPSEPKQGGSPGKYTFPPEHPLFFRAFLILCVVFTSWGLGGVWGGRRNHFPSWLASTGGKKFPLGDACHVPQ